MSITNCLSKCQTECLCFAYCFDSFDLLNSEWKLLCALLAFATMSTNDYYLVASIDVMCIYYSGKGEFLYLSFQPNKFAGKFQMKNEISYSHLIYYVWALSIPISEQVIVGLGNDQQNAVWSLINRRAKWMWVRKRVTRRESERKSKNGKQIEADCCGHLLNRCPLELNEFITILISTFEYYKLYWKRAIVCSSFNESKDFMDVSTWKIK